MSCTDQRAPQQTCASAAVCGLEGHGLEAKNMYLIAM